MTCDDDCWVFIDGRLLVDNGGLHASKTVSRSILDLPGPPLNHEMSYIMDVFFAERHTSHSEFTMFTNFIAAQDHCPVCELCPSYSSEPCVCPSESSVGCPPCNYSSESSDGSQHFPIT